MLVLSRKLMETIVIGDDIRVTVVEIRGDRVRLGVEAPKNISVHRHQVYDAIRGKALETECKGHGRGGGVTCCERAGEYNGFGSGGPLAFRCPKGCSCHD